MRHTKLASFISTALYLASLCVLSACDNNHGIRKTTYVTAQSRSEPAQSARTITSNIQVRFNEVVSSNITLKDEYDDTPDWIELYNSTRDGLSLKGWSISDNIDKPDKWTFGAATITAKGYLKIWASGKDQTNIGHYKTYLSLQDTFSYTLPTEGVDESWTHLSFNDSSWQQGLPGFGFGYADDTTLLPEGTISVFIRKKFTTTHIDTIK